MGKRIFWACQAGGIAAKDSVSYAAIHGLQSISMTTTFNLEQVFELGQLSVYENIEDIPDVEVTMEKVLDGYPLIFHRATQGATQGTLVGRSNQQCNIALSIFGDTQNAASGTPVAEVNCSGMYLSSVTYTLPVDGNCTEAVTLVGNNKTWRSSGFTFSGALFNDADQPLALTSGWGGVQRRENIIFDSKVDNTATLLPGGVGGVYGISTSGTNDKDSSGQFGAHVQSITISADLGRDAIFELGRKAPYYRFVSWPVEVTTAIEVLSTHGDQIKATEAGAVGDGDNLSNETILVVLEDSTKFNMGSKNKLSNVTYGGGDATGGNATVTYTYSTFNFLTISQNQNPST